MLDIEMQVGNTTAIDKRLVVYSSKLVAGDIKVSEKYPDAKNTIVICITTDNILKRRWIFNRHDKLLHNRVNKI